MKKGENRGNNEASVGEMMENEGRVGEMMENEGRVGKRVSSLNFLKSSLVFEVDVESE